MLKITARQIVVGTGAGILAGLLVVAFESYSPEETCEYDEHNQTPNDENCTVYSIFLFSLIQIGKALKALNDYGGGITGIATVFLAIITAGLVFVAIDQSKTTRRQLRAYLGAAWGDIFIQDATHPFQIRPAIRNYGLTPAYDVTFTGGAEVLNYPLPNDATLTYGVESKPWATLWPNANNLGMIEMGRMLSVAEIDEIKSPVGKRLYAFGRLEYRDAFKRKRYTEFCFSVVWDQLGRAIGGETAGYHTKSN
jgi:hypothetical protein